MNPILSLLNGGTGNNKLGLMMRAFNAAMRGESAESFMANLAKEDPRFQGIDFSNLEQTAHNLCRQKGVNENALIEDVKNQINNLK